MSETVKGLITNTIRDANAWIDGEDETQEWDADLLLRDCVTALRAAQEELAAVRRVEAWLMQQPLTNYIARNYDGHYEATAAGRVVPNTEAHADSLAALGRLLTEGENG